MIIACYLKELKVPKNLWFFFFLQGSLNAAQGSNRFTSHPKVLTEVALNFLLNQVQNFIKLHEYSGDLNNGIAWCIQIMGMCVGSPNHRLEKSDTHIQTTI